MGSRCLTMLAVVLCTCATSFGTITFSSNTLTYSSPSDLGTTIDPSGQKDVANSYGVSKSSFQALSPKVVAFNGAPSPTQTLRTLVVNYTASSTVTFTFPSAMYNYGSMSSVGRGSFSGSSAQDAISTVPVQNGSLYDWLDATITSTGGQGVQSIGFCAGFRNDQAVAAGQVLYTLSDSTTGSVTLPALGGSGNPEYVFIGYTAPSGKTITRVQASRTSAAGGGWVSVDDLAFVMSPDTTAPAAVSNLSCSNLTTTSVQLNWTAPGDDGSTGTATAYDIRYSTSAITAGNFSSATAVTGVPAPAAAGTNQNVTVSGLTADTTYYFAMKTADEVPNWSAISNVPSAKTSDTVAPAAVSNLATGSITASSITLSWTAPGDNGSSGTATTYDIRYSTSTINAGNFSSATQVTGVPAPAAAGTNQSVTVSGLAGDTTYYFAMKTADEVPNWSAISNVPSAKTSDTVAPAAVSNLATSSPTGTSITLSWTAPGDNGSTGTATSYDIRYSTSTINAGNFSSATQVTGVPAPQVAGTNQSVTVSGLANQTTYYFAMKTADEVPNWSTISNVVSASTLDAVAPAAVSNLATSSPTYSSITLSWTAPGDDGSTGTAATYDIRYSTSTINAGNWASATQVTGEPAPAVAGTNQNMVISGLASGTTYYFAMKTADEVPNWSAISNVPSGTTTAQTCTWTGGAYVSDNETTRYWDIAGNWNPATVPGAGMIGLINITSNYVIADADLPGSPTIQVATGGSVVHQNGATLTMPVTLSGGIWHTSPWWNGSHQYDGTWQTNRNINGPLTVTAPSFIKGTRGSGITIGGQIDGSALLTFLSDDSYSGVGPTWIISHANNPLSGEILLETGNYPAVWATASQALGTGNVTVRSTGTLVFGANQDYSGAPRTPVLYLEGAATGMTDHLSGATIPFNVVVQSLGGSLGAGTWASNNTYSGSVTLNGPLTLAGSRGNTGSVGYAITGQISGSNTVTVNTTDQYQGLRSTVSLANASNNYTGGTIVQMGYLTATSEGALSSGPITLYNPDSMTALYLSKPAHANWTISNTLYGSGTIQVEGGSGYTLNTSGTLSPGIGAGNVGSITVQGNLGFNAGATLAIDVNASPLSADGIVVTGNVTNLSNATLSISVTGDQNAVSGHQFTILTCANDLTGQAFGNVTIPTGWTKTMAYGNGFVKVTLTLPDTTPPAAITNLTTSSPTLSSITLSWTAPGDDGSTGTATTYDIRYSTSTITAGNFSSATQVTGTPAPAAAGTNQNMVVGGLSASTTYYFAMKTADEVPNWSTISNVASGTTSAPVESIIALKRDAGMTAGGAIDSRFNSATVRTVTVSDAAIYDVADSRWMNAGRLSVSVSAPTLLYKFDLSSIPANSTINLAQLRIYHDGGNSTYGNGSVAMVLTHDWTEGTGTQDIGSYPGAAGGVSWAHPNGHNTGPNQDANGGTTGSLQTWGASSNAFFSMSADAGTALDPFSAPIGTGYHVFDMTSHVQQWVNGTTPNYGWAQNRGGWTFNMSEAGTANEPVLFVDYTSGGGGDSTPPAAVTNLATSNPTSNSITLSWTAPSDPDSSCTAYDIRYSTSTITAGNFSGATQVSGAPAPASPGTNQQMTVSGLSPSTTYYFAMKTSDGVPNWSAISNVPSGTTSAASDTTPPAAVANLATSSPTSSSITLSWTAPGDDGNTGTATTYDIRYSTSTITAGNFSSATQVTGAPAPQVAGTNQSMTVSGLSASTTYYFAMKTADEVPNWSTISNVPSGTTTSGADTTAPAAVSNLATTSPTNTTITLTWTAPGDDGSTGTATTYDIRYSTSTINSGNWASATQVSGEPTPLVAGTNQSMTITGLTANTIYYFAMKTADEVPNWSGLSNVPSGTTTNTSGNNNPVLAPKDFKYLGYYVVPTGGQSGGTEWGQSFTHRYVGGQLRFLTMSFFGNIAGGGYQLIEFAPPANLGGTCTFTNHWPDIFAGTGLSTGGGGSVWIGLWYEQAHERLWNTWAIIYPSSDQYPWTKSMAVRTLNTDGTISNAAGPWGLSGVQQRRIYGGMAAVPQWFQTTYGTGAYAAGWGGVASIASVGVSDGPTFYTFPDPSTYTPGDIPTSDFKTIMDHAYATTAPDWYAQGYPTSYDRGVRNCDVSNELDSGGWLSPAPDGLGRWTWAEAVFNTGTWIETANKQGFVIVPTFFSGRSWYQTSTIHCERLTAEIQVFDPNMLGQVAQGARASWNTNPTYRWQITDDLRPLNLMYALDGTGPTGGTAGASYDPTTQKLYVFCPMDSHGISYVVVYEVGNGNASVKDVAISETSITGTVGGYGGYGLPGNRANTETNDGVYETIAEVLTGGTSQLEQKWTFSVTGGSSVTFNVKGYHNSNSDGDDFVFAYSTDGSNWTNMVTVTKTADDGNFQSYSMPANTSGTVYVRVRDTDRTAGHNNLDTIYIDEMNFTSNP